MSNTVVNGVQEMETQIAEFQAQVLKNNADQPEFLQAFCEIYMSLKPAFLKNKKYLDCFKILAEPERCVIFRVTWFDDAGKIRVNRGYRVQYSSALGPYKGGLRFHPSVNLSVVKFLGFEQVFKNSLTNLQMGGGKGGSDFDPKGKSDAEIRRFCQSFMTELTRHIGPSRDVPAGDIGVGGREIGYMFGQYKRLTMQYEGALTGKAMEWGGSAIRPEATGYGCVYFIEEALRHFKKESVSGKTCCLSGCGNVALYCAEKLNELGAKVLTLSDSSGMLFAKEGFSLDDVKNIIVMKEANPTIRVDAICKTLKGVEVRRNSSPWSISCDMAFPCATQNEMDLTDAKNLVASKCLAVVEGANMPVTAEAVDYLKHNGVIVCPAKAANAGGVAVSGLEMSQNAMRVQWSREVVDAKLRQIMADVFQKCTEAAKDVNLKEDDLVAGANISGFMKVAEAVIAQGFI